MAPGACGHDDCETDCALSDPTGIAETRLPRRTPPEREMAANAWVERAASYRRERDDAREAVRVLAASIPWALADGDGPGAVLRDSAIEVLRAALLHPAVVAALREVDQ